MSEPYLGEIRLFSFAFAPRGWAFCNGQLLPINQNQALFSLLGTNYGGNGQTTFALPNLQGRVPLHFGTGVGASYSLGQAAGAQTQTLSLAEIPQHGHTAKGSASGADRGSAAGNYWAAGAGAYSSATDGAMAGVAIASAGGGQPHENTSPYAVISMCIALQGIYPSQS